MSEECNYVIRPGTYHDYPEQCSEDAEPGEEFCRWHLDDHDE